MARTVRNSGKLWTGKDVQQLKSLVKQNTSTRVIGVKLGRTTDAIYSKASSLKISLLPRDKATGKKKPKRGNGSVGPGRRK
jgi:hypothetical protein